MVSEGRFAPAAFLAFAKSFGFEKLRSEKLVPTLIHYSLDMIRIGDALLKVTNAYRINYETWGNGEAALHTHIMPRYMDEPEDKRKSPACTKYDWKAARPFDPVRDREFVEKMKAALAPHSGVHLSAILADGG